MAEKPDHCPDAEMLAAFVEGSSAGRQRILRHLAACARCDEVVAEAIRCLYDMERGQRPRKGRILPFIVRSKGEPSG